MCEVVVNIEVNSSCFSNVRVLSITEPGRSLVDAKELIEKIISQPTKLSEEQRAAVLSSTKHTKVVAGAGAGKTETLTRRVVYSLLVEHVKPSSIVAFTFTERAARSMKSRIYQRVGEISGPTILKKLGQMYIGTIHAYANRILEDYFGYGNYSILDEDQEIAFLFRYGWSLQLDGLGENYAEGCKTFLRTVNMVWGEMLDESELEAKAPDFYQRLKKYEALLNEHKLLTFGRMIRDAVICLQKDPHGLPSIDQLIVDEYQDINRAQSMLISLVARNGNIFVVGDPRQSIYQWRGSNESFFDSFSSTFPDTVLCPITDNRRSAWKIVRNANTFAESFAFTSYDPMNPVRPDSGLVVLSPHETPEEEACWIADQIEDLVGKKKLSLSDIGLLTRSVSTSGGPVIEELKRRRIPYIVGGKIGLFRRDEAQALGRIFAWLWNEGFWVSNPWKWGSDQLRGDELLESGLLLWNNAHNHGTPANARYSLIQVRNSLQSTQPQYQNFTQVYHTILNTLGFVNLDFRERNDAAVLANLGRFHNLLTDYETANRIGGRTPNWNRDLKGLCWFMNSYAVGSYEEQPADDIRTLDAVQVMTIHQAKGLEWPVVILFATVDRRFPPVQLGRKLNWCGVPRELFDADRYEGGIEDEKRLFYVGITRAKDVLVTSYFRHIKNSVSRSRFIELTDSGVVRTVADDDLLPSFSFTPSSPSEEMNTFSAGEIVKYNICPHRYLLGNVWGYQPGLNDAIGYGKALHFCLRRAGEIVKKGASPLGAISLAVETDFHVPFAGGTVFKNFKEAAKRMLMKFGQKYGNDLARIDEVEYRLEFPLQDATLIGKVDVILKGGGALEVRDYKTSEEARTEEEASHQVRLYSLGLIEVGRTVNSGSIAYLEEPRVVNVDVKGSRLADTKVEADETVTKILSKQFSATPGDCCNRCDHQPICRWKRG